MLHFMRFVFLIMTAVLPSFSLAFATDDTVNDTLSDAAILLDRLEQLSSVLAEHPREEGVYAQYGEVLQQLANLGPKVHPVIWERAQALGPEVPVLRGKIRDFLQDIMDNTPERTLVQLFFSNPCQSVRDTAIDGLLSRISANGPLSFALSEEELNTLVTLTLKTARENRYAGSLMHFLALCAQNDVQTRFAPILTLFQEQVHFKGPFPNSLGSYLSPRVYMLMGFLLNFKHMGEVAWEPLREAREKALKAGDTEFAKWLCLGLGFAGDPSVAQCTESVVLHDSDPYVRSVAIEAYVYSVGEATIPVLEALVDDKIESEYYELRHLRPFYIIADRAREHLRVFARDKKEREAAAEEKSQP